MLFSDKELKVINEYQNLARKRLDKGDLSMSKLQDSDYYDKLLLEYNFFLNNNGIDNFNFHDYYAPSILINLADKNIYTSLEDDRRLCSENFLNPNLDVDSIELIENFLKEKLIKPYEINEHLINCGLTKQIEKEDIKEQNKNFRNNLTFLRKNRNYVKEDIEQIEDFKNSIKKLTVLKLEQKTVIAKYLSDFQDVIEKHSDKLGMQTFCEYALKTDDNGMRNLLKTNEIKELTKNIIDFSPVINSSTNNIKYVNSIFKDITHIDIDVSKERELIKDPDKNNNKRFHL